MNSLKENINIIEYTLTGVSALMNNFKAFYNQALKTEESSPISNKKKKK